MIQKKLVIRANQRIGPHDLDILSIFYGTLLGDSHIEKRCGNVRISLQQENSNVEYLMWLWKYLSIRNYCSDIKPTLLTRIGKKNKLRYYYRLNTWTFSSLNFLYHEFYWDKSNKKRIPYSLKTNLTPLALACWIMDDGSKVGSGLKICTNSFMYEDLVFAQEIFKQKFNLNPSIHSAGVKDQYILYFKKSEMNLLRTIVSPYIVPSMRYKIL